MDTLLHDSIQFASKSPELKFNSGESFFEMFIYLLFVLGLIFLCAFILKKTGFIQSKMPKKISSAVAELLGQITLSQSDKILVLKIIDSVQFLLVSQHSSTILKEVSLTEFNKLNIASSGSENSFKTIFNSIMNKDKNEN